MRKILLIIISFCLLTLPLGTPLEANGRGVEVRPAGKESLETEPMRIITTVFRVTNKSAEKQELASNIELPEGWRLITKDLLFELGANESKMRLVSFFIPQTTLAGEYEVLFFVRGEYTSTISDSCPIRVVVSPVAKVEVKLLKAPAHVIAGEDYQASFVVANEGNIENTVRIKIDSEANLPFIVGDEEFKLAPAESKTIRVVVETDIMKEKLDHHLSLTAQILEDEKTQAQATSLVEIIPRITEGEDESHKLPVEITLRQATQKNNEEDKSGFQTEISGKGPLDEEGKKYIKFLFRGPDIYDKSAFSERDQYSFSFWTKDYEFHLGDHRYFLSSLTENDYYSRGISGKLNLNNFSWGAGYHKTRWIEPEEKQIGGYIRYLIREKYRLGLNYLKKTGADRAEIVSLEAQLRPAENTHVEFEYALGKKDKKDDDASWLRVYGYRRWISYRLGFTHAGPDYPGYYRNIDSLMAVLAFSLKDNLRLNANFGQGKNKSDSGPTIYSASWEKYYQLGLNYNLKPDTVLSFDWRDHYREGQLPNFDFDSQEKSFRFGIEHSLKKLNLSASAESGKTDELNNQSSYLQRYTASAYFRPTKRQTYKGSLSYSNYKDFTGRKPRYITGGLKGSFRISESTFFELDFQTNDYARYYQGERDILEARLTHTLPNGHKIPMRGRYTSYRDSHLKDESTLMIEYIIPFGLSISKKNNTGTVKGYVYDEKTKEPIPDIIVRLNGYTAVTDKKGRFIFPSVKPRKYYLHIDREGIALNQIPVRKTPIEVVVEGGQERRLEIGMAQPATLSGEIMVYRLRNGYHKLNGENGPNNRYIAGDNNGVILNGNKGELAEDYVLANVLVELVNGSEIERRVTDKKGRFEFEELRPGKWTLKIHDNNLPEYYHFEKDTFEFELEPGQKNALLVKVLPMKRHIHLVGEGGTLQEKETIW